MSAYLEYPIAFCVFGILFTAAERLWPARRIDYRTVLKGDIGAVFVYGLVFLPISVHVSNQLVPSNIIPSPQPTSRMSRFGVPWTRATTSRRYLL